MLSQIIAKLPIAFSELSADEQAYLTSISNPRGGYSDEAIALFEGCRLQCDDAALEAIALFNASSHGLLIQPDAQDRISVELLTDCGDTGNYRALQEVLMGLAIVAVNG